MLRHQQLNWSGNGTGRMTAVEQYSVSFILVRAIAAGMLAAAGLFVALTFADAQGPSLAGPPAPAVIALSVHPQ
jgi:hypothetical protein